MVATCCTGHTHIFIYKQQIMQSVKYLHSGIFNNYRAEGGIEAERKERDNWMNKEKRRIQDSVNGEVNYV